MTEQFDIPSASNNVPEFTVSEISGAIRRTLEGTFSRVRVRGEITELKRYPSGHVYFSLKDERGKISGVVWRGSVSRLGLAPENGVEIIATGKISAYGERSSYQLVVERMEYAGEGALLARIERLRIRLAEEGLFDTACKKAIPLLPRVIGVVTSPQGAVLHDICTTLQRRFPRPVIVWPVPVQGEGAAARIAAAIDGFSQLDGQGAVPRPDVLIVARGGGSLEDLMAFNDEAVVRAAAACTIPLISAVGHETDTTLIDFASDRRAPTPTAAAEMAVPVRTELLADIEHRNARALGALSRLLQTARLRLDRASSAMPDLPSLLQTARMQLDDRGRRLDVALPALVQRRKADLVAIERHMPAVETLLAGRRTRLAVLANMLQASMAHTFQKQDARLGRLRISPAPLQALVRERRTALAGIAGQLEAVSPRAVLARGYALVTAEGRPVTSAEQLRDGERVELTFGDGARPAVIGDGTRQPKQGVLEL
ncbi:exodeoxyribonuclease 7 large subunit [Acetobacter pasteurianus]|uniref:Exodeoxyribonuclease 7 large subunit n=2 Tax=Acetobacter pasteurianus TaxID=438 RepID=C7JAQ2_ACEP3|nr:exodeoxyribonuclease VII large subunit [Acetobacter pasteurianus]BAU37100.1 exodeoxyribonuclease VII large subunit [Acetobacter pasteurianus NBRC 101655]ASC05576.1 Exodeoxyribonuclease VII [Acetobacter pasteurianus subsp. pasteurianus]CCT59584.1 exodeoxyribonuclease VII large subunit [Acetobacter pasteurianus 386B]BAH98178.1 exodeoxyribonuclease VII large subunit [Acetobacter pasteurianus IFO 3283-01]BAI01229.1 exodeoxyribonuclease VII large subunit [Acetobacter pasteurianus IFO 3283-03]